VDFIILDFFFFLTQIYFFQIFFCSQSANFYLSTREYDPNFYGVHCFMSFRYLLSLNSFQMTHLYLKVMKVMNIYHLHHLPFYFNNFIIIIIIIFDYFRLLTYFQFIYFTMLISASVIKFNILN
jgi:hypothetical protein